MTTLRVRIAAALIAGTLAFAAQAQSPAASTTIILVRHAEKEAQPAADPPLTVAGTARAAALAEALKDAGVRAVVTTQFVRTRATAAPLAARLGITPEVTDARAPDHVASLVAGLLAHHRGETVLVVGHSNTVPALVAALGAPAPPPICDAEYDNLYVVTVPAAGPATVVRLRYGVGTPVEAGCGAMK